MGSYKVKYKSDSDNQSWTTKANSPLDAYLAFLELDDTPLKDEEIVVEGNFLSGSETFNDHLEVAEEKKEEEAIKTNSKQIKSLLESTPDLIENGFSKLPFSKIREILKVVERTLLTDEFTEDEYRLTQMILSDSAAYRFLVLRSNYLSNQQQQSMLEGMNANLSDISKKTGAVKTASLFTGMAAARHLGEEIGGGED